MKLSRIKPEKKFGSGDIAKGVEISHMITVSMSHITEQTKDEMMCDGINNKLMVPIYAKTVPNDNDPGFGFYVYLNNQCLREGDFPEDLVNVIDFALRNGCDILCLDCDGPEIEELPIYEWRD